MTIRRRLIALMLWLASAWALACTPPSPPAEYSGFVRHQINRLPQNAAGVMFLSARGAVRPRDFAVTSAEDKRPLAVRVRRIKNQAWVRLELVHGFQPGARYQIRYLPKHEPWEYPDSLNVAIDRQAASDQGDYALVLSGPAKHKAVIVPYSGGSCTTLAPVVVQEFSYQLPRGLEAYRDLLDYGIAMDLQRQPEQTAQAPGNSWFDAPELYAANGSFMDGGRASLYSAHRNAVVAPCGRRWPAGTLSGHIQFPELNDTLHRIAAVPFDLNGASGADCSPLGTLLQSIAGQPPESALNRLCGWGLLPGPDMQTLRSVPLDEWERALDFLFDMQPTCTLVALSHLWRTGQMSTDPAVLQRLGTALELGLQRARRPERDAAVHALAYLVEQQPASTRAAIARGFLAPLRSALVDLLAGPAPVRPREVAVLLSHAGLLPPQLRTRLHVIADGATPGAPYARQLLAGRRI